MITHSKFLLRFFLVYFVIYIFPFPLNLIPFLSDFTGWINDGMTAAVLWIANSILGIETEPPRPSGSGDTHFNYVYTLVNFIVAVLVSVIWSIFDRKKRDYKAINYWFWTYLRFFLAAQLVVYGLMKVFPLQMSAPTFTRLIQPFGTFSPMGLAWSYVGFSTGYEIFVGAMEVVAGLLLLHRRSTLLGGLVSIIVMLNVAAINFFFDVPVKLFSVTLVIISIIVVAPQIRKLFRLLFGTKSVEPLPIYCPIKERKWKIVKEAVKWTLVIAFIGYRIDSSYDSLYSYGMLRPKTPLYGLYEIETFKLNGEERPPLLTDSLRWRYVVSEYAGRMTLFNMNQKATWLKAKVDTMQREVKLISYRDSTEVSRFQYKKSDSTLIWDGIYKGDTIYFKSKRLYKKDFPLMSRGFNWVQEYPYNR